VLSVDIEPALAFPPLKVALNGELEAPFYPMPGGARKYIVIFKPPRQKQQSVTIANLPYVIYGEHLSISNNIGSWADGSFLSDVTRRSVIRELDIISLQEKIRTALIDDAHGWRISLVVLLCPEANRDNIPITIYFYGPFRSHRDVSSLSYVEGVFSDVSGFFGSVGGSLSYSGRDAL
jgi:hypothetical protein